MIRRFRAARGWCLPALLALAAMTARGAEIREGLIRVEYPEAYAALARESATILRDSLDEYAPHLPPGDAPIVVVLCDTHPRFARYAGGLAQISVTGVSMPEDGVIAVKTPNLVPGGMDYRGTLRHELIHVLLARNTDADNLPRWLNEGIAMMVSGEHRWESSMRVARMYAEGRLISYRDLFFVFFEPGKGEQFGNAYAQALSMTRYLIDRVGEARFWRIVLDTKTRSFGDALRAEASMSPMDFYNDWVGSLWKVALIFSLVSGFSIFQVMAILTVVAYLRRRRKNRELVRAWEDEEAAAGGDEGGEILPWDWEDESTWEEDED